MRHRMELLFLAPGSPAPDSSLVASPRVQTSLSSLKPGNLGPRWRPLGLSASVGRMGGFREGEEGWE